MREFQPRTMNEKEMKKKLEYVVMEEERERESRSRLLSPLKAPDSIETSLLD